jgi:hypothetical protein
MNLLLLLQRFINKLLYTVFLWCGSRFFNHISWMSDEHTGRIHTMIFALNERSHNIAVRSFVDVLDDPELKAQFDAQKHAKL